MSESRNIILTWEIIDSNNVELTYYFYGHDKVDFVTVSIDAAPEVTPTLEQMVALRSDVRNNLESNPQINRFKMSLALEDWAFSGATMPSYHGDGK